MNLAGRHILKIGNRLQMAVKTILRDHVFLRRYVMVGMGNVIVNFGVFWCVYRYLGVWYVFASFIGFLSRFVFKFALLRYWVFGYRSKQRIGVHLGQFALLEGASYFVGLPLLIFLVEWLHLPPPLGVILTIAVLYVFGMSMARFIFHARTVEGQDLYT